MAKYTIENGIYKKDGKPVFALGVSYYPSYHERKVPVPPDGDRIGELNKDIKGMHDFGFNIVNIVEFCGFSAIIRHIIIFDEVIT